MLLIVFPALFWAGATAVAAEPHFPSWFRFETYRDEAGEHRYAVYVPQSYTDSGAAARQWPVMLFLHGAGERGTDGYRQLTVGLGPVLRHRPDFPFVVVFPQCEDVGGRYLTGWLASTPDARRALKVLQQVEQKYATDRKRRVLSGWSMGGYGAWSIAAAHPEMWSAVLPISGGGDPDSLKGLAEAKTPVWAIHGAEDPLIRPEQSLKMVQALQQLGGNAVYSELPGVGHDIGPVVFRSDAVPEWLLDPSSVDVEQIDWTPVIAAARRERGNLTDFVPTAVGRRVIGVRLGNTALQTLAEGIPEAVPAEALSGTLDDITRSFGEGRERVEVRFSGIRYEVQVTSARIAAVSGGRFRVCFALSPVVLRFERTAINGGPVRAEAGPFQIELGTQRPVWLDLEVRPEAVNGKVHLAPLQQKFKFGDDNWFVSPPQQVRIERGEFKPEQIVTGIVGGTYLHRDTVEEQVRGVVPGLLRTIEDRLSRIDTSQLTAALWPLPVLSPELQLRPAAIRTDGEGVSVLLDVLVGFPSATRPPPTLQQLPVAPLTFDQVGRSRELDVFAQLDIISALSLVAVEQGDARINVLDIPEPSFAHLARPDFIRSVLPDVPDVTEFRAIVALVTPFDVELQDAHDGASTLQLSTDGLRLYFQGRADELQSWQDLGAYDISVKQRLLVIAVDGPAEGSGLKVQWQDGAEVSARPVGVRVTAAQTEQLQNEVRADWVAWATSQPEKVTHIPDIEAGGASLSWKTLVWRPTKGGPGETVELQFRTPTTTVVNESNQPVFYEVRAATSGWSGPHLLEPGETHGYHVGYDLKWREFKVKGPVEETYTISRGGTLTLGPRQQVRVAADGQ